MRGPTMGTLAVSMALVLAGTLFTGTAHAANGVFFYRHQLGELRNLVNPPSDQCIPLTGGAHEADNRTDHKALLYQDGNCTQSTLQLTLVPGQQLNFFPFLVNSVRFEFA